MDTQLSTLRGKVRQALDDITPNAVDSFSQSTNSEIDQALLHAAISLSQTVPVDLLEPTVKGNLNPTESGSSGYVALDSTSLSNTFLRFVSFTTDKWKATVFELMEAGSEAEKMQRSRWTQGTATKPKAMLDNIADNSKSKKVLRYWPFTTNEKATLVYVKMPSVSSSSLTCDLKAETEKNIIYLACRIFLEGKKESTAAEAFAKLVEL